MQQVDVFRGVEQEVIASAPVILPERGQEVVDIKVRLRHLDVAFLHFFAVHVPHIFVERVERRHDVLVLTEQEDIGVHRAAQLRRLSFRGGFVLAFPQGEQQRLDTVLLLHVEHPVVRVERVERDGLVLRVGEVDAVPALGLAMYHLAQPLVGVARVHQYHVGALLKVLADKVVHEERLAAARRPQHELVAVRRHAALHRQVGDVDVQGLAADAVRHADAEGRRRVLVVGLAREEAYRLSDERVERLFRRKVRRIAGDARPEQCRAVRRVVARHAAHACQLAAHIIFDMFQFLRVIAPRHHVEVGADGLQPLRVRLVQVFLHPFAVDGVLAAVPGERLHVACSLLEAAQLLVAVADEHVLVVDVVAGQQQAQRCGERQAAVRAVGGEPLVTAVRGHRGGQILRIRQGVQAQAVVADAHLPRRHLDVLQTVHVTQRQGEVPPDDARFLISSDKLVIGEPAQFDMPRIVQDTRELLHRLDELHRRFLVLYLLRHDVPPAQRVPVALLAQPFLRGFRQEQVALVVQERPLVEVHLVAAGKEAHVLPAEIGTVLFLHVPVLFVQHRMVGQHLYCLAPRCVDVLVLLRRDGIDLRQLHLEGGGDVRVLRDDAAVLHR
ncbi:hypothetical protein BSBG_02217 [Bacteroides sp. 9_1_42FAA]|nr:hypothetical protein BSBG_02217 [Bacteroides sp. 9_1_42FAA]